jgi:hypothetical protein
MSAHSLADFVSVAPLVLADQGQPGIREASAVRISILAYEPVETGARMVQPDLKIAQFLFPPTDDKALRVHVSNAGGGNAGACVLRLTVRKINGVAVGRVTEIPVPGIAAGTDTWLLIHADSILPKNVALKDTTFKLNIDATGVVNESDETNNEVWHNL